MSSVVFMRAVNVGGQKRFQPSLLAKQLGHLGLVNLGAAGTFVCHGTLGRADLRGALLGALPFDTELMICSGRDLLALSAAAPFPAGALPPDVRRFVSVLAKRPGKLPALPLSHPAGDQWEVKLVAVSGRFALSLWRRLGRSFVDPNGVIEKRLGVSATTRNWNTILKICDVLKPDRS